MGRDGEQEWRLVIMKRIIIIILFSFLASCATTPSPAQDSVIVCPYLKTPFIIKKGFFDNEDNWISKEKFFKLLMEQIQKLEPNV